MNRKMTMTLCYSAAHLFVDMGCAVLLYFLGRDKLAPEQIAEFIFLYDFIAFVLQLPMGMLLDTGKVKTGNYLLAAVGCGVIAAGNLLAYYVPLFGEYLWTAMLLAILVGLGNALFHVSAGIDVLNAGGKEATLPGIFVSTGAFGLYLGARSGGVAAFKLLLMAIVLAVMMQAIRMYCPQPAGKGPSPRDISRKAGGLWKMDAGRTSKTAGEGPRSLRLPGASAVLFTLVIIFRSYLGFVMKYTWRSAFWLGFAATLCVVAGKMLGGILGDRFGWKKTMAASLLLCAVSGLFSEVSGICGLITLLLFNMTMPITMTGLANVLSWRKGTAFGINTTALFVGFVWARYSGDATPAGQLQWLLAGEILVSAVLVYAALILEEKA